MKAAGIKYVRSNEVNDIFSYFIKSEEHGENELLYTSFPRTMEMTEQDVHNFLNLE